MTAIKPIMRVFFLVSGLILSTTSAVANDYLPHALRAQVEQLKLDLRQQPTTAINASARAIVTWEWINAFALNNGYVPVNATQMVAGVLSPVNETTRPLRALYIRGLDDTIAELAFLDENPTGLGTLQADLGPFTVAQPATIKQTYTVGSVPVQKGGTFVVAQHFMTAGAGPWQAANPKGENFISIASSNPQARFKVGEIPWLGMHGGFRASRPTLTFELTKGTLARGDTVTIVYGDTSKGSPGLTLPSFSTDRLPLPLYVSHEPNAPYLSLPIQPIVTRGSELAGVAAFAPSIVAPGEPFTLSVRGQDAHFNRATSGITGWRIFRNDELWHELEADSAITEWQTQIKVPGTYFIRVEQVTGDDSTDNTITGEGNPILVTASGQERIFWGDTHGHSGFAEGIGTPERFMRWARDDARLDFVTHSEHDIWLDDAEWAVLQDNVIRYTEEGRFIAFLGYEWSVRNFFGGHHNVLFRTPEGRRRIPAQFYPTLSQLYQGLRETAGPQDVVVIPHAHQAGDYRQSDPELEPLIEIMSQHGNFEWFGRLYLEHGHQIGFTAASDNHLSQPGYSAPQGGSLSQRGGLGAIMAQAKTVNGIFNSMKNLRAYATTGDRMILDFEVNGAPMGTRTSFSETREITGRVIGTAPIDSITVIKNDAVAWQQNYLDETEAATTYLLSFASDSRPFHPGDNPRGWRGWEGKLTVSGARLVRAEAVDSGFPLQRLEQSSSAPAQVDFATKTRGDTSSMLITLAEPGRNARIAIELDAVREIGGGPPVYRAQQQSAAERFTFTLRDLRDQADNRLVHTQAVDAYTDTVTLRAVRTNGEREIEFKFTDTGTKHGDYYFVRVVQANEAMAWSSPVWVGGHPPR